MEENASILAWRIMDILSLKENRNKQREEQTVLIRQVLFDALVAVKNHSEKNAIRKCVRQLEDLNLTDQSN